MKKLLSCVCLNVITFIWIASLAYAVDIIPYVKFGTIDTDEQDHSSAVGHKAMLGVGTSVVGGDKFRKEFNAEIWSALEPTDEDREMIHDGLLLSAKGSYHFELNKNFEIYPLAGLGLERWRRNSPEGNQDEFFGDLTFAKIIAGFGARYNNAYCVFEGLLPVWADTDSGQSPSGRLGFATKVGVLLRENIDCGLFYKQISFQGDGSQTDFQMEQYGVLIGYRF